MKKHALIAFAAVAIAAGSLVAFTPAQSEKLAAADVKKTLEGLGFEVTVTEAAEGKEAYQVTHAAGGFNIPMSVSLAPSKNYLYFIANLGTTDKLDGKTDAYKNLLAENSKIQPCFFFVGGGNLKITAVMENRGIQAADMKRTIEMLGDKVGQTKDLWQVTSQD